jgi:hypothetical protein
MIGRAMIALAFASSWLAVAPYPSNAERALARTSLEKDVLPVAVGLRLRWGSEGGTCVGGYPNGHPDLMDIYLVYDDSSETYLGEEEHGTYSGCDYHDVLWWRYWGSNSICTSGGCNVGPMPGPVLTHQHHSNCQH